MKKSILMAIALFSLILGVVLGSIRSVSLFADDDDGIIEWNSIGVEELV
ncbi:hypothetical protein ACF3M2_12455 [Tissierella carlieri]